MGGAGLTGKNQITLQFFFPNTVYHFSFCHADVCSSVYLISSSPSNVEEVSYNSCAKNAPSCG